MYGRDPDQFWRLTLREITTIFDGDRQRIENDQALAYYQAYMSGVFSQSYDKGKFPPYEKHAPWQRARGPAEPQSWEKQKMIAQALNAAYGGTVSKKVH